MLLRKPKQGVEISTYRSAGPSFTEPKRGTEGLSQPALKVLKLCPKEMHELTPSCRDNGMTGLRWGRGSGRDVSPFLLASRSTNGVTMGRERG